VNVESTFDVHLPIGGYYIDDDNYFWKVRCKAPLGLKNEVITPVVDEVERRGWDPKLYRTVRRNGNISR